MLSDHLCNLSVQLNKPAFHSGRIAWQSSTAKRLFPVPAAPRRSIQETTASDRMNLFSFSRSTSRPTNTVARAENGNQETAATPILIASPTVDAGPLVSRRQSGFEHRWPALLANPRTISNLKSSRLIGVTLDHLRAENSIHSPSRSRFPA